MKSQYLQINKRKILNHFHTLKKKVKIFFLGNYKIFSRSNYFTILLNQFILFYEIKKINHNKFDHIYFNTFSVVDKAIAILGPPLLRQNFQV